MANTRMTLEIMQLRNTLPQNIMNDVHMKEIAKDIVSHELTDYPELDRLVQKGIKYVLMAGLTELYQTRAVRDRTLGNLFLWARSQTLTHTSPESDQYFDMIALMPTEVVNLARFHICDKLMKYSVFEKAG